MTFLECLYECIGTPELVKEFDRLTGYSLGVDRRSIMDRMVDDASGHEPDKAAIEAFIAFVWDCIWVRIPR